MNQRRISTGASLVFLVSFPILAGMTATGQLRQSFSKGSSGAVYVVSNQGDDSNDGTAGSPWATLQRAADVAIAGDIVLVENGEYTGFNSQHDGVTFRANGDSVIVNEAGSYSGLDNINIENNDDVVVEGFIVRDAPRAGIRVVNAARAIVRNNEVGPNGKWGIFSGFAPDIQVLDNVTFGSEEQHGIYLSNSEGAEDNPTVRGNESYGNNVNGIQFNGDCYAGGDGVLEGGVIENNVVHDNGAKGLSIISAPGVRIQNNVIYENRRNGSGAAGIHLVDEPGCGKPTRNAVVVNNTIVEPRMAGIRINDGASENVIFNNLIVSDNPIADEVGGNAINEPSNLFATTGEGLFANASDNDYDLIENAAAIDAGVAAFENVMAPTVDMAGRDRGAPPDAGAFEFDEGASVGVQDELFQRGGALLEPAYPNPFSDVATLRFTVAPPQQVSVGLYDSRGRLVRVLFEGVAEGNGPHEVRVAGVGLPSAVYFVRMEAAGTMVSRPVVVVP